MTPLSSSTGRRTRFTEADLRILAALDQPRSASEISDVLLRDLREAWAREEFDAEWDEVADVPTAKLMAASRATAQGTPYLGGWQVYPRLRKLERCGLVGRIQIEGCRPILWRRMDG